MVNKQSMLIKALKNIDLRTPYRYQVFTTMIVAVCVKQLLKCCLENSNALSTSMAYGRYEKEDVNSWPFKYSCPSWYTFVIVSAYTRKQI